MSSEQNNSIASVPSVAPAEGERRAVSGYYAQYKVAASLILRALGEESLQWIRVADPLAGRVDDVQIGTQSRVDAFQVKWSEYGGNLTFNDLVKSSGGKPCLIAQLAHGWGLLRERHSGYRVVVHLVTNKGPSVSDSASIPVRDPPPRPRHFAAFIEQVWNPARQALPDCGWTVPEPWQPAWQKLRVASCLPREDFEAFVRDCDLEFVYRLGGNATATARDREVAQKDLDHLGEMLFATVADPERIIELSRDRLLALLGWEARFELRSRHEFPTPEIPYHPIEATVCELQDGLSNLSGGYIAVLGTPGSGKSTLLTQTLLRRPERNMKYYAYVPDAQDPSTLRGESSNFLHDIVLQLDRAGFRVGGGPGNFERGQLLERFHRQLQLLHEDWQTTGVGTLILVDGLDHIEREQNPSRSLLLDLPRPDQVPDGVYFVLGSQTDQLRELPDRVQHSIQQPGRRIQMTPLSRKAVLQISDRMGLPVALSQEQKEHVYRLSDGHPLALVYLLNRLGNAVDAEAREAVLQSAESYEGDIEAQYHSYWRQIESDSELVHLLGLLARMRGVIKLSRLKAWAGVPAVDRLSRRLAHYFRIENHDRWYFFHNSFRLFLLAKTAESTPGSADPTRNQAFHHELAEKCAEEPAGSRWAWEELYHRFSAGEHAAVLERASPEWFRSQFLAFRPIDAIRADIQVALRSAEACQDPVALSRAILVGAEIAQREFHLEASSIVPLLLRIAEEDVAVENVRDGNRLRISATEALRASVDLRASRLEEESSRVFNLAEPLDLLTVPKPIEIDPQDEKGALLEAWAEAAVHFRDLDKIIDTIRHVQGVDRLGQRDAETVTRSLQNRMLFHAGLALLDQSRWEDLSELCAAFDTEHGSDVEWWFWLQVHSYKHCLVAKDQTRAQGFVEEILRRGGTLDLGAEECVALAEAAFLVLRDEEKARQWVQDVPQPALRTDVLIPGDDRLAMDPFLQRFRLNRLLHALGLGLPSEQIVPDTGEAREQDMVHFERAVCAVARIWGMAWRGETLEGSAILPHILPLLRFFNRSTQETRHWTSWYVVKAARAEFYRLLVDAVAQHGMAAIESLRVEFVGEWEDSGSGGFWPVDVRRQVVLALERVGVKRRWAVERLEGLEDTMLRDHEVSGRVEECRKQAEAWIALDDDQSAYRLLQEMLRVSSGVGYRKDHQLNAWIRWLGRINEAEPTRAPERIMWYARAIVTLEETTEGDASRHAALELLSTAFRWSPRRAIGLFNWFVDQRVIWHEDAVRALLKEALGAEESTTQLVLFSLSDFLLPIATEADTEIAALLIEETAERHGSEEAMESARHLLSKVDVWALPSTRLDWRRGIAQALDGLGLDPRCVGLEPRDSRPSREEDSTFSLKLKDGSTVLSTDEVRSRVCSAPDIAQLMDGESDESAFDWEPIVTDLAGEFSGEDVHQLAKLFHGKRRSALILAGLAHRLWALGDTPAARSLAEQALDASEAYGWDKWYDGGSRLAAFTVLVKTDEEVARRRAFECLVRDLTGEFWYPQNIARNLDEILPLLADDLSVQQIWSEVDQYVRTLFSGSSWPASSPTHIREDPPHDTPSRALGDLLMTHLDHPANAVGQGAQRACLGLLLRGNPAMRKAVEEYLDRSESHQEQILMLLDAVSIGEPQAVAPFRDRIADLVHSPSYAIRWIARTICNRVGVEPSAASGVLSTLPGIYRLSFPSHRTATVTQREKISPDEPLPDSEDPVEIVRPFGAQIEFLAEEAQLSKTSVCHRVVQIMRELAPEDSWSAEGERLLRFTLDTTRLRLSFRRPRSALARRAMFHVMAELVDAGALDSSSIASLEPVVRFHDPQMLLAELAARPQVVHRMTGRPQRGVGHDDWLEQVEEASDLVGFENSDGRVILAEETTLKHLEWETPTEMRRSMACRAAIRSFDPRGDFNSLFWQVTNRLVTEYPTLQVNVLPTPLVVRHAGYGYDSPGESWLAFNPVVAHELGWNLAGDGLFRWVDGDGTIMVESTWWADGLVGQSPPHFDDEVGEGWLVVAGPAAWHAISSRFEGLRRLVAVSRSYRHNGQLIERYASSADSL